MGSVWPAACCAARKLDDEVEEGEHDREQEEVVPLGAVPWDREPPMDVPRSDSRDSRVTTLPADLASPRAAEKRWTRAGPSAPPPLRAGLFEPFN